MDLFWFEAQTIATFIFPMLDTSLVPLMDPTPCPQKVHPGTCFVSLAPAQANLCGCALIKVDFLAFYMSLFETC